MFEIGDMTITLPSIGIGSAADMAVQLGNESRPEALWMLTCMLRGMLCTYCNTATACNFTPGVHGDKHAHRPAHGGCSVCQTCSQTRTTKCALIVQEQKQAHIATA